MKKRFLAAAMATIMALSAVGCSSSEAPKAETTKAAEAKADSTEQAEAYVPEGDFNIRVFAAAGGVADTISRITAQSLQETYGITPIVSNLTGASGAVAVADMDAYDPSIHEMSVVSMSLFTMAPIMNPDLKVSMDDYEMVGSLVKDEFVMFVSKDSGITSWEELVEYGKSNQIIYGSNTPGGFTHIVQTALFGEAGLDAQALTSDGSNKDILAVMSGDAICAAATATLAKSYIENGDLIPIVAFSEDTFKGFEGHEVPSAKSLGFDVVLPSYNFMICRAGVDKAEIEGFYDAVLACRETEGFKTSAAGANYIPDATTGEELKTEIEAYAAFCQEVHDKYY